jgi:hypothetical protein
LGRLRFFIINEIDFCVFEITPWRAGSRALCLSFDARALSALCGRKGSVAILIARVFITLYGRVFLSRDHATAKLQRPLIPNL